MKAVGICVLLGGGVFFVGLLQMGVLRSGMTGPAQGPAVEKKEPKAKFPDDLSPAAQAKAVAKAAAFKPGPGIHKIVFMTPAGDLHPWHESLPEDWQADTVEQTELVVVVGKQQKTLVQHVLYGTAPPIDRVRFEVEVSVVEAKTGAILDNRSFRNLPRPCRVNEVYATTMIGRVVQWGTVFRWISEKSKTGFPEETDSYPIDTQVD